MENGSEIQLLVYQEGYVRLFLEGGEDRLAKNRETCHKGKVISYHAVSEEWFLLSSLVLPPLEQLIEKEQILELMGLLTERQRDIVILYFYYGETQWEIAKELGITQPQFLRRLRQHFAGCGTVRRKTVPLERKRILKELNEKLKEMGIMGGCF